MAFLPGLDNDENLKPLQKEEVASNSCCPQCKSTKLDVIGVGNINYKCMDCSNIWPAGGVSGILIMNNEEQTEYIKEYEEYVKMAEWENW